MINNASKIFIFVYLLKEI